MTVVYENMQTVKMTVKYTIKLLCESNNIKKISKSLKFITTEKGVQTSLLTRHFSASRKLYLHLSNVI